jgi:predicted transcriptional regulator
MDMPRHPDKTTPPASVAKPADHFLRLMFFEPHGHDTHGARNDGPPTEPTLQFYPLPQARLRKAATYYLPDADRVMLRVHAGSPAIDVMTDLNRIAAATIGRLATVEEANQAMIAQGVRSLFVVDQRRILGIVTATDVLGEKPVQVGHELGVRHDEVMVRDIMTPADELEVIDFGIVLEATVGDVVATLKRAGRQHALVSDLQEASTRQRVRGIFSLTQIARHLGIASVTPDIHRTFADIETSFRLG